MPFRMNDPLLEASIVQSESWGLFRPFSQPSFYVSAFFIETCNTLYRYQVINVDTNVQGVLAIRGLVFRGFAIRGFLKP